MTSPLWRFPPAALARDVVLSAIERTTSATVDAILDSPRTERLVDRALEQPGLDRLIQRVLDSEEMDQIVRRIAESPEVRAAIASQTSGLAGEVGDQVRTRAVAADGGVERAVRRLLGRKAASVEDGDLPDAG